MSPHAPMCGVAAPTVLSGKNGKIACFCCDQIAVSNSK